MKNKIFQGPEDFPKINAEDCDILFKEVDINRGNSITLNEL